MPEHRPNKGEQIKTERMIKKFPLQSTLSEKMVKICSDINIGNKRSSEKKVHKVLCSLLWVTLLGQGAGLGDPQRSLPTLTIL